LKNDTVSKTAPKREGETGQGKTQSQAFGYGGGQKRGGEKWSPTSRPMRPGLLERVNGGDPGGGNGNCLHAKPEAWHAKVTKRKQGPWVHRLPRRGTRQTTKEETGERSSLKLVEKGQGGQYLPQGLERGFRGRKKNPGNHFQRGFSPRGSEGIRNPQLAGSSWSLKGGQVFFPEEKREVEVPKNEGGGQRRGEFDSPQQKPTKVKCFYMSAKEVEKKNFPMGNH